MDKLADLDRQIAFARRIVSKVPTTLADTEEIDYWRTRLANLLIERDCLARGAENSNGADNEG